MKPIAIYGCGEEGKKFVLNNADIRIEVAIDNNYQMETFFGIPVKTPQEIRNIVHDYFIVFTVGTQHFEDIQKFVSENNLIEFEDYEFSRYYKRKLCVLYGNCHTRIMANYFSIIPEFIRKYDVVNYLICEFDSCKMNNFIMDVKHSDLVITQDIRKDNIFDAPSYIDINQIAKNDVVIVPNLHGMNIYYPQFNKERLYEYEINKWNGMRFSTIGRPDDFIEESYKNGIDAYSLVKSINEDEVYSENYIRRQFDEEISKLRKREDNCSFTISDYILSNFRKKKLFHDPVHPANVLIKEKVRKILDILHFDKNVVIADIGVMNELDQQDIYIYGCVRKALNLSFEQTYLRNNMKTGYRHKPITIDEYVEDYYRILEYESVNGLWAE